MAKRPRHTSEQTFLRGRARREEILDAAMELFRQDGYRGTGLGAIAAKVGVSQPTLRHHFGTKAQLLRAVVERRQEQDLAAASPFTTAGGAAVFDILDRLPDYMRRREGLVQLHLVLRTENLLPEHPVHDWFIRFHDDTRRFFVEALTKGRDRGELDPAMDVDAVAAIVIALIEGLETQWLLDPTTVDIDQVLESSAAALRERYVVKTGSRTQ